MGVLTSFSTKEDQGGETHKLHIVFMLLLGGGINAEFIGGGAFSMRN